MTVKEIRIRLYTGDFDQKLKKAKKEVEEIKGTWNTLMDNKVVAWRIFTRTAMSGLRTISRLAGKSAILTNIQTGFAVATTEAAIARLIVRATAYASDPLTAALAPGLYIQAGVMQMDLAVAIMQREQSRTIQVEAEMLNNFIDGL